MLRSRADKEDDDDDDDDDDVDDDDDDEWQEDNQDTYYNRVKRHIRTFLTNNKQFMTTKYYVQLL